MIAKILAEMNPSKFALIYVLGFFFSIPEYISTEAIKYKEGDHVEIYVNKVGPYWNPVNILIN